MSWHNIGSCYQHTFCLHAEIRWYLRSGVSNAGGFLFLRVSVFIRHHGIMLFSYSSEFSSMSSGFHGFRQQCITWFYSCEYVIMQYFVIFDRTLLENKLTTTATATATATFTAIATATLLLLHSYCYHCHYHCHRCYCYCYYNYYYYCYYYYYYCYHHHYHYHYY